MSESDGKGDVYEPPRVEDLGTLQEITWTVNPSAANDGMPAKS